MIRRLSSLVLATSLLAACAPLDSALKTLDLGVLSPGSGDDTLPDAKTDTAVLVDVPAVEATAKTTNAEPPMPRRKPVEATMVARREFHPDLLVGLDFNATKALLGDPALQSEEPPAKIWAYNGGTCMLHVFFYPSVGDNIFRVLTYEVRGGDIKQDGTTVDLSAATKISDKNSPVVRSCFAELLQGREVPDAG